MARLERSATSFTQTSRRPVIGEGLDGLVEAIAAGDQLALHALYERTHRVVYTLIVRMISNRETAEDLTLDVFHDVWRQASRYDARRYRPGLDHEPGAVQGHRPVALRTAEETGPPACETIRWRRTRSGLPRIFDLQGARPDVRDALRSSRRTSAR